MTTAFKDLEGELAATPLATMRVEIARRGYRLETWKAEHSRLPWCVLVIDDASADADDPWAALVAWEMNGRTERDAVASVMEDIRISHWTVAFPEPEIQA